MKITLKKETSALPQIQAAIERFVEQESLDGRTSLDLQLAIEEVYTNFVRHDSGEGDRVEIELRRNQDRLEITLTSFDVEKFDLTQAEVELEGVALESRRAGGMGLYMTRQVVNEISYSYIDGNSIITMIKRLDG